jgi:hypothetical protein
MKRAVIIWPGEPGEIEQVFASHSLHLHAAASSFMSRELPSVGQVFVFDRGFPFPPLPNSPYDDISFSGPIIEDISHNSPHFHPSDQQPLQPVLVSVMFWPLSMKGLVNVELDGFPLVEIPILLQNDNRDFETPVTLPDSLANGTHVIVLRATSDSNTARTIAQSSVVIVVGNRPPSKWLGSVPTLDALNQVALEPPPRIIPQHLISEFTMNHTADVDYM